MKKEELETEGRSEEYRLAEMCSRGILLDDYDWDNFIHKFRRLTMERNNRACCCMYEQRVRVTGVK